MCMEQIHDLFKFGKKFVIIFDRSCRLIGRCYYLCYKLTFLFAILKIINQFND